MVTDSDQEFYHKLNVPSPTLCPDCRQQRRFAFRNESYYYQRQCAKTNATVVSSYSPDGPVKKVYDRDLWFSDAWSAYDYGRDFDFSRPFFEQFSELMYDVPHPALWNWESENADYNHCCYHLKNSYMNSATDKSEEAYYCNISIDCRSVADSIAIQESELAIECIDSDHLYMSAYCQQCRNCMNAYLSFDCTGCKYIFGCTGLRNKEYYMFNKSVSQQEWEERVPQLLASYSALQQAQAEAQANGLTVPRLYNAIYNSQDCSGNYIWNSVNCALSYDVREGQNVKYVTYAPWQSKDAMDCYAIGKGELLYEANYGLAGYNNQFNMWLMDGPNNSQYNVYCVNNCDNVFGNMGLNKQQYAIFNKQYTKQDYEKLRDKIIAHMRETGEYGEFFPITMSPYGYNETIAQEYYPLNKADVERAGWTWQDNTGGTFGKETLETAKYADNIEECTDQITQEVLACMNCKKNYKIVPQEFALYKKLGLALPRLCPHCRHLRRIELRNPRSLWQRQCMCVSPEHDKHTGRCANEFETTYSPDRKEIVYCQECYNQEMY